MLRDITDTRNSMRGKRVRIHINIANDQRVKSKLTVTFLSRSSLLSVSGYIYLFRSHVSFPTNIVNWLNWNKKQYPEINLEEWFYSFSDFLTTCSETRALIILTLSCFVDCAVKIFSVDQVLDYLARYDCKKNSTGIVISGTSRQSLSFSQAQGYLNSCYNSCEVYSSQRGPRDRVWIFVFGWSAHQQHNTPFFSSY